MANWDMTIDHIVANTKSPIFSDTRVNYRKHHPTSHARAARWPNTKSVCHHPKARGSHLAPASHLAATSSNRLVQAMEVQTPWFLFRCENGNLIYIYIFNISNEI